MPSFDTIDTFDSYWQFWHTSTIYFYFFSTCQQTKAYLFFFFVYNTPSWKLKQLGAQAKHGSLIKSANGLFQIWLKLGKNPNFRQFFENNILYCCLVNCIGILCTCILPSYLGKQGQTHTLVLIIFVMNKKITCKNFFSTWQPKLGPIFCCAIHFANVGMVTLRRPMCFY